MRELWGGDVRTSWCDKLASTPAVGAFFEKQFDSSASVLDKLRPLVSSWTKGDEDDFTMTKQDPFSVELTTNSGLHYGVTPGNLFVEFRHRIRISQRSGTAPVAEMLSQPRPYTSLLGEVSEKLLEANDLLNPSLRTRTLKRVGVVSLTHVAPEDLPPGLSRFIEYMGRPWGGDLYGYDFQVVARLDKSEKWDDSCIHHLSLPEAGDRLVQVRIDYQRRFHESRRSSQLAESLKHVTSTALDYFEGLAEGGRFHVE